MTIPPRNPARTAQKTNIFVILLLVPVNTLVTGLLVRYMYHRLLTPTFSDLPQHLGLGAAIGLTLFVSFMTSDEASIGNDQRSLVEKEASFFLYRGAMALMTLVVGLWV